MADLRLDPSDGRETGLSLPRRPFEPQPEPVQPTSPLVELARQLLVDYDAKVAARTAELAEVGLGLEPVGFGTVPGEDLTSVRVQGTFRVVSLDGGS